jgi:hypothetical protein
LALHHQDGAQQIGIDAVVIGRSRYAFLQWLGVAFGAGCGCGRRYVAAHQQDKKTEFEKPWQIKNE